MFNLINIMYKKNWKKYKLNYVSSRFVSKSTGVYMILDVAKWTHGIPLGLKILYVGKGNIRNRFLDHLSIFREHNNKLAKKIILSNLEFWFLETDKKGMDSIETKLIENISSVDQNLTNISKNPNFIKSISNKGEKHHV